MRPALSPMVAAFVPGDPAPQGSKRHVGRGILVESSKRVQPWRADVRQALLDLGTLNGPVRVELTFHFARPASHYGTGRNANVLKPSAPKRPTSRRHGDIDKLARATLDAIVSAGTIADDDLVVDLWASKRYVDERSDLQGQWDTGCDVRIIEVSP